MECGLILGYLYLNIVYFVWLLYYAFWNYLNLAFHNVNIFIYVGFSFLNTSLVVVCRFIELKCNILYGFSWITSKSNYIIITLLNYINMYTGTLIIICMIFFKMISALRNISNIVIKCSIVFADIPFFASHEQWKIWLV